MSIKHTIRNGRHRQNRGFTLIEVMVVTTLSVLLMLGASALFMTFLISNTKTTTTQLVKSEGDTALAQMEFLIRNAIELRQNSLGDTCELNMDELVVRSLDGGVTTLFAEQDNGDWKIASNSGVYLTSGSVDLVNNNGRIRFDCVQESGTAAPHVTITFELRKGTPGVDQPKDIVEETFSTGVTVRSY